MYLLHNFRLKLIHTHTRTHTHAHIHTTLPSMPMLEVYGHVMVLFVTHTHVGNKNIRQKEKKESGESHFENKKRK